MKIRVFMILILGVVFGLQISGQTKEIDSLKTIVHSNTTDRYTGREALLKLTSALADINEYDSAEIYDRLSSKFLPKTLDTLSMDTTDIYLLTSLGSGYQFYDLPTAILFSTEALEWAKKLHFRRGEGFASATLAENLRLKGDYARSLELFLNSLRISREINDEGQEKISLLFIGIAYSSMGAYRIGLNYMFEGLALPHKIGYRPVFPFILSYIGYSYEKLNSLDSALYFQEMALKISDSLVQPYSPLRSVILGSLGTIHARRKNPELAKNCYHEAIAIHDYLNLGISQYLLGDLLYSQKEFDSSFFYAKHSFTNCQNSSQESWVIESSRLLAKLFMERKEIDSAFRYQGIALALRDSIFSPQKFNDLQLAAINDQQDIYEIKQRQIEARQEKENLDNRIKVYGLLAILLVILLIAVILFHNNRQKIKANSLLEQQKVEITNALTDLKNTQAQLIQSEKMASLGELTAGIAHEIQNPLNFINNFSDVNTELTRELVDAAQKGDFNEVTQLANDIKSNEEKIREHGLRADSIVKGMLQHSRTGPIQKELTDINALAEEYLRLAYHGFRARDTNFNAILETHFDPSIGKTSIVPQDISRVLLNLFNNAFYAVAEKQKLNGKEYSPLVSVSTQKNGQSMEIKVKDNGLGIPEKIKDKVFQPFFTTKPTGQGTGLGLSLSYDIVKTHGGEISIHSVNGEGSEFSVQLPAKK